MYGDNIYKALLFLHVGSVVAAFAPAVISPLLAERFADEDAAVRQRLAGYLRTNDRQVHAPALILAGLFGIVLIIRSDEVIKFDDLWINLAFLNWFVMNGVLHGLIMGGQKKVAAGDESGIQRVKVGGLLINLLFALMLYLMVFQPN